MVYLYLRGFASSPASRKARFFIEKLQANNIQLQALDLATDFENLTITGQLATIESAAQGQPAVLIGSSLGGYLAALYAAHQPDAVERVVLLAPAFDFYQLWKKELGPIKLREWRERGSMPVYHYGAGREVPLNFQLMEDAQRYPGFPDFKQPCLIFHGLRDEVVPFESSAQFAAAHHDSARLLPVDSNHDLTDVLNEIWTSSCDFLLDANTMQAVRT